MNIENHPCFNPKVCHQFGRIHLPVSPRCNIQCNFCNRKYDCVNESRPGVSSGVLSPKQALAFLDKLLERVKNISVVGIAGPGDPFANPAETLETLELVRDKYPDMLLCLASNGLNLAPYLDDLARLKVSHVSITLNALDPDIGKKIYAWVRHDKRVFDPETGAKILLEKQLEAISGLKERNIIVKINSIVLPGINDDHMEAIAKEMAGKNVDILNCMPYYPNKGANFEHLQEPSPTMMKKIRKAAGRHIPQMLHCKRCRADAVGLLGDSNSNEVTELLKSCESLPKTSDFNADRPYVAVASREGVLVNQHLGEAKQLYIFRKKKRSVALVEIRHAPEAGGGDSRWETLAGQISDCRALLVSGIGNAPRRVLKNRGISIFQIEGVIETAASAVFNGTSLNYLMPRKPNACGDSCRGTGMGCM